MGGPSFFFGLWLRVARWMPAGTPALLSAQRRACAFLRVRLHRGGLWIGKLCVARDSCRAFVPGRAGVGSLSRTPVGALNFLCGSIIAVATNYLERAFAPRAS